MKDIFQSNISKFSMSVFFLFIIALFLLPQSGPPSISKPANVEGCYESNNAPSLEIKQNYLIINQPNHIVTKFSYGVDNTSKLIYPVQPIVLNSIDSGELFFEIDPKKAKFIRIDHASEEKLKVFSSNEITVTYHKVEC
jgi:hypothetical protein